MAAELLNHRILTTKEAAELFGLDEKQISALKMVFPTEVGLKTAKERNGLRRHVEAREIVFREWDRGDADETYEGRHQRLKDEHGFKFGRQAMALIKRYGISDRTPSEPAPG